MRSLAFSYVREDDRLSLQFGVSVEVEDSAANAAHVVFYLN